MWIEHFIFYAAAVVLIGSGLMVILAKNTVHAALFLILAFFASAVIWLTLEAEFLALILILVYVGAVMTLFLFVLMMLNLDALPRTGNYVRYLPYGILVLALVMAGIYYSVGAEHFGLTKIAAPAPVSEQYSNVRALGDVLYTDYVYPFELAAVLLLAAIIAAISLSLRIPRGKRQNARLQQQVDKKDRISLGAVDNSLLLSSCRDLFAASIPKPNMDPADKPRDDV